MLHAVRQNHGCQFVVGERQHADACEGSGECNFLQSAVAERPVADFLNGIRHIHGIELFIFRRKQTGIAVGGTDFFYLFSIRCLAWNDQVLVHFSFGNAAFGKSGNRAVLVVFKVLRIPQSLIRILICLRSVAHNQFLVRGIDIGILTLHGVKPVLKLILQPRIVGVHIYQTGSSCLFMELLFQYVFLAPRILFRCFGHSRVKGECGFVHHLGEVREAHRFDVVKRKRHAVKFHHKVRRHRELNIGNLIVRKALAFNPPDGLREFYFYNLISFKGLCQYGNNARRENDFFQLISIKRALANHEVSAAGDPFFVGLCQRIVVRSQHSRRELNRFQTLFFKCALADSHDILSIRSLRRDYQILVALQFLFTLLGKTGDDFSANIKLPAVVTTVHELFVFSIGEIRCCPFIADRLGAGILCRLCRFF